MNDLILSRHARLRMTLRAITERDILDVLAEPERVVEGSRVLTRNFYRVVRGRPLVVVLAYDSDPPTVVTVMLDLRQ